MPLFLLHIVYYESASDTSVFFCKSEKHMPEKPYGGRYRQRKDPVMEFRIEKAVESDYQLFADIIQTVWRGMDNKDWYFADDSDYTCHMLASGEGLGYKAFETKTGAVAGVFLAVMPGLSDENMGRDAGLPEEELPKVAHMDTAAVLPQYRGHQLQCRLMQAAEEDLRALGFRYLMATVHPDNIYSMNNGLKQGYRIIGEKIKHGGKRRAILMKELA